MWGRFLTACLRLSGEHEGHEGHEAKTLESDLAIPIVRFAIWNGKPQNQNLATFFSHRHSAFCRLLTFAPFVSFVFTPVFYAASRRDRRRMRRAMLK